VLSITQFTPEELGLVLTPSRTAVFMVLEILKSFKKNEKILDPCTGPGIFIKKFIEFGVNPNNLYAYDLDPTYQKKFEKLGIHFEEKDSLLSIDSNSQNRFDYIIANPPYLNKSSKYVSQNKPKLKELYGHINAHETYSMFIVNSIWRLKEGGKLIFITSDSFLTLKSHRKLRNFILNHCKINFILLPPKKLFNSQEVAIKTVIFKLTKCTGKEKRKEREENEIVIIPRLHHESEYANPPKRRKLKQKKYTLLPFEIFYIDVEDEIIDLFEEAPKLSDYIGGSIGMHTHNNRKYIAAIEGTKLAKLFKKRNKRIRDEVKKYKIISKEEFESPRWKPYLKRGGGDKYYRPIMEALDWREKSIEIYDIPKNAPFEEEGIVISGVSTHLAARYMSSGCYWDSNKAMGFIIKDPAFSIHYVLGLLNSSLYNYLAKGIINNTNSIQLTAINSLPLIKPHEHVKESVERLVRKIIKEKSENIAYNYSKEQKKIDEIIFNFHSREFKLPIELKKKLDKKFSIF
jgi:phospholipid N-methyltransferase